MAQPDPESVGVVEMMRRRARARRDRARAGRLHQRARHVDAARRRRRDAGDQGGLRRPRVRARRVVDEVGDRPLLRRGGRDRGDDVRARGPRRRAAADDQLRAPRSRSATSTTCRTRRARREVDVALSNAMGLGGHNGCVLVGRVDSTTPRRRHARRSAANRARRRPRRAPRRPAGRTGSGSRSTRIPAAFALRMPLCESSTAAQRGRVDAEPPRRLEVDVRRRLAARDLLGRDRRGEEAARAPPARAPRRSAAGSTTTRRRAASAPRAARPPRRAPGDQRQPLAVPRLHAPHDLVGDLLRLLGHAELVVHVPRPLERAHPHHRPLRLVVVAAAALARAAPRAPRPRAPPSGSARRPGRRRRRRSRGVVLARRRRRARGARRPELDRETSPTKNVWSPASCSRDDAALEPAERAFEQRRRLPLARDSIPVPVRDRRHAAREVLRERRPGRRRAG